MLDTTRSPTHLTMQLPMHIVWNPDVHEFARSKTSADPAIEEKAAGVGRIHVPMRPMHASLSVPIAASLPRRGSASLAPQPYDMVFERPGGTCFCSDANPHLVAVQSVNRRHPESNGQERTDRNPTRPLFSSANSTLASGIWPSDPLSYRRCLYARRSLPPRRSVMYEMHCNYQNCPPAHAGLLQLHDAECDVFSQPRTSYHAYALAPQHQAPAHPRDDTQQALPFLHARRPRRPPRAQRRSSAESPSAFSARACAHLHAPQLGCTTPTSRSTRCVHSQSHMPLSSRLPVMVAPVLPHSPLDAGPLSTRALGRIIHQHVPLLANAAHLAGVLQHSRCLHRLATHCESSQPQSMQECALPARIGRTTHTTTVYGVHGACFSSPTRRRPAPPLWIAPACSPVASRPAGASFTRCTATTCTARHPRQPSVANLTTHTLQSPGRPYHAHALNTRLPRTLDDTQAAPAFPPRAPALVDPHGRNNDLRAAPASIPHPISYAAFLASARFPRLRPLSSPPPEMVAPALPHSSPLDAGPSPRARFGAPYPSRHLPRTARRRTPPPPYAASTVPVSRGPRAAVPPRRSAPPPAAVSSEVPPSPLDACPCSSHQQHHLPHPRQLRQAVPRHRHRLRHLLAPNEHLRRTTLRARLSTPLSTTHSATGVRTTYGGHFPIAHVVSKRVARNPQRYITLSLEFPPAATPANTRSTTSDLHNGRSGECPSPTPRFFTTVLSCPPR
ncbi:hypothetical protein B0H14DRAFT_3489928 [Mycena olivaceomarginata]|nr:hypothetical protein B0H14DRAFT_3489928 [Mycena olivaceomarginata]